MKKYIIRILLKLLHKLGYQEEQRSPYRTKLDEIKHRTYILYMEASRARLHYYKEDFEDKWVIKRLLREYPILSPLVASNIMEEVRNAKFN